MAAFVIAGKSDCPSFAQVEALADYMAANLNSFEVHKVIIPTERWSGWLKNCCKERGWSHSGSPLVWRELVDRAGKGLYMGGETEFFEYAKHYYNLSPILDAETAKAIAAENVVTEELLVEEKLSWRNAQDELLTVCVTNASSPFAYNFLQWLISGQTCPSNHALTVRLLVSDSNLRAEADGVCMEMMDCARGNLRLVTVTDRPDEAFVHCSLVVILDEPEGDCSGGVQAYAGRLKTYSREIAKHSHSNVLVAVSGSHANLGATVVWKTAGDDVVFKKERQVIAIGQAGERRAMSLIAERLGVHSHQVNNVVAWGRTDDPCLVTITEARVYRHAGAIIGPDNYGKKVVSILHDHKWINLKITEEAKMAKRSPMSAAAGLAQITQLWLEPTSAIPDQLFSLGLISDGQFGLPADIAFVVPARISPMGTWEPVVGYHLSEEQLSALAAEAEHLSEEVMKVSMSTSPLHASHL